MSTTPTLESILVETTPQLTESESARLFTQITAAVPVVSVVSPYQFTFFVFKPMSYLALFLVLLLGAGGTVAASGSAKPGDLLFPIERATEEVRLALASDGQKVALQNQFINERFTELQTILNEEKVPTIAATATDQTILSASAALVAASSSLQFTAKVFTDTTVVQTTVGSSTPVYFIMNVTATDAIVTGIALRYGLTNTFVVSHLTIADQYLVSAASDTGGTVVRPSGEARVANAIAVLAQQLADQSDSVKRETYLRTLLTEVSSVHVAGRDDAPLRLDAARVTIEDNQNEVRAKGEHVRIEQNHGQVDIKVDHSSRDSKGSPWGSMHKNTPATSTPSHTEQSDNQKDSRDDSEDDHDRGEVFRILPSGTTTTSMEIDTNRNWRGHGGGNQLPAERHDNSHGQSEDGRDN